MDSVKEKSDTLIKNDQFYKKETQLTFKKNPETFRHDHKIVIIDGLMVQYYIQNICLSSQIIQLTSHKDLILPSK